MSIFDKLSGYFGTAGNPGGANPQPAAPSGFNAFFSNMLSGATRGVEQNLSTSTFGQKLFGALAQGQSQVAAQHLFGNPLMLVAVLVALAFLAYLIMRK